MTRTRLALLLFAAALTGAAPAAQGPPMGPGGPNQPANPTCPQDGSGAPPRG